LNPLLYKFATVRAHSSAERSHLLLELEIIQIAVKKVSGVNHLEIG